MLATPLLSSCFQSVKYYDHSEEDKECHNHQNGDGVGEEL